LVPLIDKRYSSPFLNIHDMHYPSNELVTFERDNSNGISLYPILPTFIRNARHQGEAR
jgi:hypothetical protein